MPATQPNLAGLAPGTRISQVMLADLIHVTTKTVRNWKDQGVLPEPYRLGTIEFWTPEQIQHWLADQNLPDGYIKSVSETNAH